MLQPHSALLPNLNPPPQRGIEFLSFFHGCRPGSHAARCPACWHLSPGLAQASAGWCSASADTNAAAVAKLLLLWRRLIDQPLLLLQLLLLVPRQDTLGCKPRWIAAACDDDGRCYPLRRMPRCAALHAHHVVAEGLNNHLATRCGNFNTPTRTVEFLADGSSSARLCMRPRKASTPHTTSI